MDKLQKLSLACKNSVTLSINKHRDYCKPVEEYINELKLIKSIDDEDVDLIMLNKMIECDTIVELYMFPDTSLGFYAIFGYDVETVLDRGLNCFSEYVSIFNLIISDLISRLDIPNVKFHHYDIKNNYTYKCEFENSKNIDTNENLIKYFISWLQTIQQGYVDVYLELKLYGLEDRIGIKAYIK